MATVGDRLIPDVAQPAEPDTVRQSGLYRWGLAVARHRRVVLGVFALLLIVSAVAYPALQRALGAPGYGFSGTESARVEQLIERLFPDLGSENDLVVFHSSRLLAGDAPYRATIAAVDRAVRGQRGVRNVVGPYDPSAVGQILGEEHVAVTGVSLGGSPNQRFNGARAIQAAVTRAAGDNGVQVWFTGASPILKDLSEKQKSDTEQAEMIGVPVALAILLLALGTLVAAMVPLLLAVSGLLLTYGVLTAFTLLFHFDSLLLAIVSMVGLGIGIDYSLFIVCRFREELARAGTGERDRGGVGERDESERVADAVGVALAKSGRTILFSGVIVALSMASMFVVKAAVFREIAGGTVAVVICMLVTAMTLLPAALALLGAGIERGALPRRLQPADARPQGDGEQRGAWARWALLMMRRPVLVAAVTGAVLLAAAIPVLHLHYGFSVDVLQDTSTASGKGERLLAQTLTPGAVGPTQIVLAGRGARSGLGFDVAAAKSLGGQLENDQRVTGVFEHRGSAGVLLTVVPAVAIDSPTATALVGHIRADLAPRLERGRRLTVLVGGSTAKAVDVTDELDEKFPVIMALILGTSLLFLLVVLRSVVLPIKAVLMNLLATGATIGLVVWVFQDGHGHRLLGFTTTGFIQATVPIVMFALLFGLSMDYEVFLIRRMQEEWRRTGDNRLAVAAGIEHTARPITAAAAIMVAVFGSFMTANLLELKQFGFALAAAIAIDATLVRLILVPATMCLLGARNWWLPAWLARVLPRFGVD